MATIPDNYLTRVYAGILSKLIGVYLGRPFEQWTHQRILQELGPIEGYVNDRLNQPLVVTDDDVAGTFNDPVYAKTKCFDPFPFPETTQAQKTCLRALGEDLGAHRKARQAEHPKLTLTGMYNVLEKLRTGERIEGRDREVCDQGLIGILRDQIDAATAESYGWPATLTDDAILQNLVTLNRTRAAEEARGQIRWLRPDYQNPAGHAAAKGEQTELAVGFATPKVLRCLLFIRRRYGMLSLFASMSLVAMKPALDEPSTEATKLLSRTPPLRLIRICRVRPARIQHRYIDRTIAVRVQVLPVTLPPSSIQPERDSGVQFCPVGRIVQRGLARSWSSGNTPTPGTPAARSSHGQP